MQTGQPNNTHKLHYLTTAVTALLFSFHCAIPEPTPGEDDSGAASANVVVEESGGQTILTEGADNDTVTIRLSEKPEATVSIAVDDGDGQVSVSPATLIFTEDNYNQAQSVTITAIDDDLAEGQHTALISIAVAAGDSLYRLLVLPDITASITDNDTAGVSLSHSSGATIVSESGIFDSYQVSLTKEPVANVTVTASVSDSDQFSATPESVTFSPENWATPQTIVVTANDDPGIEGDVGYTISHSVASSDPNYSGISLTPLNVTVRDDDTVIYVNKLATGSQNGKSWVNAYTELADAVAAAISGQDIWVATGTYTPGINRTDSFSLGAGVDLYGGFNGSETDVNDRNPTANPTILSGDNDGDDTAPFTGNGNNSYHVIEADNAGTVTISGFTVTRGNSDSTFPNERGGGLRIANSSVSLTQMIFTENNAAFGGGVYGSTPAGTTISDSDFVNNHSSDDGAGVYLGGCTGCSFSGLTFDDNDATDLGGGMFISGIGVTLNDMTFTDNDAGGDGGGLYNDAADDLTATDLDFTNNSASVDGGAVYVDAGADNGAYTRLTFTSNSAGDQGGAVYFQEGDGVTIVDSVFTDNTATDHGGGVYFDGTDNIDINGSATVFNGNDSGASGGAIYSTGTDGLTIADGNFTDNTADNTSGTIHLGGFANAAYTDLTFTNNQTVTDGAGLGGTGSVTYATGGSNWVVDNCTFTNNQAAGNAVLFSTATSGIEIRNSDFVDNTSGGASYGGGAIHLWGSADGAILADNTYTNNSGDDGGALFIEADNVTVSGSTFTDNSAPSSGGAIFATGTFLTVEDSSFTGNNSDVEGGAIYTEGSDALLQNLNFDYNWSDAGGAIFLRDGDNSTINRALVHRSWSRYDGGGIYLLDATGISVKNTLLTENSGQRGGALFLFGAGSTSNMSLQNLTVSNNYSYGLSGQHGAVFFADATPVLTAFLYNSLVYNNYGGPTVWDSNIYDHGSNPVLTFANNSIGGLIAEFQNSDNIDADPLFTEAPVAIAYTLDGPDGGTSYDGTDTVLELHTCDMVSPGDFIEYDNDGVYREVTTVDCTGSSSLVFIDGANPLPSASAANRIITIYGSSTPAADNYTPTEGQAINSGDPNYPGPGLDLAGNPRVVGGDVDMGAYETQ